MATEKPQPPSTRPGPLQKKELEPDLNPLLEPRLRQHRQPPCGCGGLCRSVYRKPDGRHLWLYSRKPMPPLPAECIPSPRGEPISLSAHMRWPPLRKEWVVYAAHRQERTFMPAASSNPLLPTADPERPTELPAGDYDVAVFENRFSSLVGHSGPATPVSGAHIQPPYGRGEAGGFSPGPQ